MAHGTRRAFVQASSHLRLRSKANSLLTSTALIPAITAFAVAGLMVQPYAASAQSTDAEGGNGGGGGGAGGDSVIVDGGTGVAGGNGVAAGSGGGGGGTGITGGNGGTGSGGTAGGVGNNVFNAPAGNGANATVAGNGGGGGAGASTRFLSGGSLSFFAGATTYISGGAGGAGLGSGSGGGGGAGATFVTDLLFNASISAGASRTGGVGGAGGNGGVTGNGGDGGDGGDGFTVVLAGINTIEAGASYIGGVGGAGGSGVVSGLGGVGGAGLNQTGGALVNQGTVRGGVGGTGSVGGLGGIGFIGSGVTINNTGTIAGGLSGSGAQALAMRLSGTNTITNIGTLTGGLEIASGTTTFDLTGDQTLSAVVSGTGALTKEGTDTLTLTGANSFTGLTTVSEGTLVIGSASALGATSAGTVVEAGATLGIESTITAGSLQVLESITLDGGTVRNITGNTNLSGTITLLADSTIISSANNLTVSGASGLQGNGNDLTANAAGGNINFTTSLTNVASLTTNGSGVVALSGSNSIAGSVTVNGGTLQVVNSGALSVANAVTLNGGALDVFRTVTVGSVSGDLRLSVNGFGSPVTLTLGGDNSSTSLSGQLSGDGNLIKTGTGTFTLTGGNNFVGGITVNDGTLQIGNGGTGGTLGLGTGTVLVDANGTLNFNRSNLYTVTNGISGSGTIVQSGRGTTVLSNAANFTGAVSVTGGQLRITGDFGGGIIVSSGILGGTGTIDGAVTINSGGTLAAGNSPGTMTVGSLTLNAGSITNFELGQAGVAGGANNDLIRVTGNLALNGGTINVTRGVGFGVGAYTLFEFGSLSGALGNLSLTPLDGDFVGTLAVDGNTVLLNAALAEDLIFWNGSTTSPTGALVGGSGTWNLTNTNFTENDGDFSGAWEGNGFQAVFGGTGGTVTIGAGLTLAPSGLAFLADGYVITGADAAAGLRFNAATGIDTATGVGATITAPISGTGSVTKTGDGVLTLGGVNTYTGSTTVLGGTLVNTGTITGAVINSATFNSTGSLLGGLTNNAGGTANLSGTVNGSIGNTGTLNVTGNLVGNGTLINNAAGLVTINSGVTGSGFTSVTNRGTAANAFAINGTLSVSGQFTNAIGARLTVGAGASLLTTPPSFQAGVTNFSGALITNAGTINNIVDNLGTVNSTGSLTGGLINNGGATANLSGTVGAVTNAGTLTVDGNLVSTAGLTNNSIGLITVNSGVSWTGLTGVSNAGSAANAFTLNGSLSTIGMFNNSSGGVLTIGATGSLSASLGMLNGANSLITNSGRINSTINNSGTLTSTGTLAGVLNNNAGSTANLAGTVAQVGNSGTLTVTGNLTGTSTFDNVPSGLVTINSGATAQITGDVSNGGTAANAFQINGTFITNGLFTNQFGGNLNVAAGGTLTAANGVSNAGGATLTNAGTITSLVRNFGTFTSTGTLQAGFNNGAGSATASLSGTVSGPVTNSGTITLTGATTGIGAVENGFFGVFNLGGFNTSFGSLAGSGTVNLGAGTLTVGGNGTSTTFDGVIGGDGGLIKTGPGTLTLSGVNTYLGETRIDEGGITLSSSGVIAGRVRNSATFINAGTVNGLVNNSGDFTSTGTVQGGLVQFSGTSTVSGTLNGAITTQGTLIVNGDLASNDFGQSLGSGLTQILGGARWSGLTGYSNGSSNSTGLVIAGTLDVSGIVVTQAVATTIIGGGGGTLTAQNMANLGTVINNGEVNSDVTNSGEIQNNGTWNGTLSQGTGSVTNTGRWNGNFLLDAGGQITNSGTWDTTSLFGTGLRDGTFDNTGNLIGLGFSVSGANARLNNDTTGVITLGAGQAFNIDNGGRIDNFGTASANANVNAGGILRNFAGASWTGTVIIAATGSVSNSGTINGGVANGGTFASLGTVNGNFNNGANALATLAGTLDGNISNSGRIQLVGTTTGINILFQGASGTFELGGFNTTFAGLQGQGQVQLGGADLTVNATSNTTFSGVISGSGDLIKTGLGTFSLTGANTFGGDVVVNGGVFFLASAGSLLGGVQNNATFINAGFVAGLTTNNATLVSDGHLSGGLLNNAGATATLANLVSGTINNSGSIILGGGLSGGATLVQTASGSFNLDGFDAVLGSLAGSGSVALGSGDLMVGGNGTSTAFDGVISGTGSLVKVGGGDFTLTGVNTNTGDTFVDAGALTLAAGGVIAGAVRNSATFTNDGTVSGRVINAGDFTSTGTVEGGLTQFSGTSTLSGTLNGTVSSAGTLIVNGDLVSNDFVQTSGSGLTQILGGTRWSGLTGFSNGSSNVTGLVIAGELDVSGIVVTQAGASTIIGGGGGVLTAQNMANLGTVTNNGEVNSDVTNSATIQNNFIWNGSLSQGTGTVTNGFLWNGAFLIDAGGVVTNNASWDNSTGFLSAVNDGLFENFGSLSGGGVNVTGTDARFANRMGGSVTLDTGAFLAADSGGIISNSGAITGSGQANAGGVIENFSGASWNGSLSVAATGSVTNTGTITGNILNSGTFFSTDTVNGMLVNQAGANASLSGNFIGDIVNSGSVSLVGTTNGIGILEQTSTGAFDLSGFDTTIGGLVGAGQVLLRAGDLTVRTSVGSTTFSGVISGSGELIKTGSFGLFLDGANTFTGLTTVNQGSLVVGATGSLVGSVLNNANLVNGGTIGGSVTNFGTFFNANRIMGGLTNNGSVQLAGQIDGAVLNNGSITNVSGAIVLGRFTQGAGGSLNLAGFNSSFGSLAGSGTIALGSAFLTVGGDNTSSTFGGVIGGTGGLVKVGSGTFTLTAVNTYSGTTFVNAGTLVIGDGAVVAPPGGQTVPPVAVTAAAPASVEVAPESGLGLLTRSAAEQTGGRTAVSLAALTGDEPAAVVVLAAEAAGEALSAVTVTATNTPLASAVIAGGVVNNATVINNGTILGQLLNNAGATTTNNGRIAGAVFNDGTLVSTGTLGGGLSNNGTAQIQGVLDGEVLNTGLITLTGTTTGIDIVDQTATGVFNLAGFNTTIGAINGAGSITLGNALLTTGTDGVASLFSGVISGTGALTKVGTGRLVLTGANTYSGGTTISSGVLQLGNGGTSGSIVGPVVNNGALVINRSDAFTFGSLISGTGMFVQDGTGTTTLTAANTYSGGTLISRGRLVGNTTSLQGQIQNSAALEFAQATNGIFAGQLFGTGLFDKTGAGLLELTGNSGGFTGGTFVRAGELRVIGSLAGSQVTVLSGATLSGTGTIGGLIANSGSIVAPGVNGAGRLGVNGAVNLMAGSTVQLQIRAGGPSDVILSNSTATLAGTAAFTNLGGVYAFNSEIVLLQADGGRSGTFGATSGFAGFGILYRPELVYSANQVRLRFAPNLLSSIVGNAPLTANQRSVVNRIDGALLAGYNPQPLFAIYSLPTVDLVAAFDQLSGEVYATAAGVGIEQERLVREAVFGRLNAVAMAALETPDAGKGAGAWGQVFGGWSHGDADGNASRFEADRSGFATGIDFGSANDEGSWRAGVFGFQIQSDVTVDRLGSRAEVEQTGGGVYASITTGGFSALAGGYLTSVDLTATRTIALPGFAEVNRGETGGDAWQAFAEVSYTIPAGKGMVRPFLGGTIGSFDLDALTETGGAAALVMRDQDYSTGTLTAGVDGTMPVGKSLTLFGSLAGRAQLGDRDPQAQLALAAAPNQAFGVAGVQLDDVALAARLDASLKLGKHVDVSVGYTGLIGSTISDHGARATLQVQF